MRRVLLSIGTMVVVVALVTGATAWATSGRRADDAIRRLEDGARRLQECHATRDTYDGCESGEGQVTNVVADEAFVLRAQVFGVGTIAISARRGGALRRTCTASSDRCVDGQWRPGGAHD